MTQAIFLSVEVPDQRRDAEYAETASAVAISAAVSALARVVLGRRPLVLRDQPGITPMLWALAESMNVDYGGCVYLYQSPHAGRIYPEDRARFNNVTVVAGVSGDTDASLDELRHQIFSRLSYSAGIFIGGGKSVYDDFQIFRTMCPDALALPIASTGGAARKAAQDFPDGNPELSANLDYIELFYRNLGINPTEDRLPSLRNEFMENAFRTTFSTSQDAFRRRARSSATVRQASAHPERPSTARPAPGEIDALLARARQPGDTAEAKAELTRAVLPVLHDIAHARLQRAQSDVMLSADELAIDACTRLLAHADSIAYRDSAHFFAVAARAIRNIVVDHLRTRASEKRAPDSRFSAGMSAGVVEGPDPIDLTVDWLAVNEALNRLETVHADCALVAELKFYSPLNTSEIAAAVGVSRETVMRNWHFAKTWLTDQLLEARKSELSADRVLPPA